MKTINANTVVVQKSDIDITDIDGEKAMMNLEKGQYFMLNTVGSDIWDIIKEPRSVKEIVASLLNEYNIDEATCEESTLEFLGRLNHADLIKVM